MIFPDSEALALAGFGKVAHVPAIFDSEPGYARLPSRFLIDRAVGAWDPKWRGARPNPSLPSRVSIKDYGYWLCNALEWAEVRGIDLMSCDYSTILIGRYQQEMLKGIWSLRGNPLSAQTVNARVGIALEFQMWAADKKYSNPISIPTSARTIRFGSYKTNFSKESKTVETRRGKVKANKRDLVFPSTEAIRTWRQQVYGQPTVGATHGLMVDHILETAIRREELACWRVDTLPLKQRDWKIINPNQPEAEQQVVIDIDRGTKGREYYIDDFGDKVGPVGSINVPLWLCNRIDAYRNGERIMALKHVTRGVRNMIKVRHLISQSVHLYLHPSTGKRYTGDQIYQLWTKVQGPDHWSPHLGRDWWACQYLWRKMQEHASLLKHIQGFRTLEGDHTLLRALKDTALQVIHLEIQPQLRHASSMTTEIYLQWLFNQLRVPLNMTLAWQNDDDQSPVGV